MNIPEACLLGAGAACAGFVNAIAGGGTLLTFPLLLLCGVSGRVANATSTAALVVGTVGGIYGFRAHLGRALPHVARLAVPSLLGGLLGSVLLTRTSGARFDAVVPVLIGGATLLFWGQGVLRRFFGLNGCRQLGGWALFFQFWIAVYGGYFGAGIGILMLGVLGVAGFEDIHLANAVKNVLNGLINGVALAWLGGCGWVDWPRAGVMTVGAVAGYFLGAHFSQRLGVEWVRRGVALSGASMSAWAVWRYWIHAGTLTN
jgi:uncharacterized membrane protein YfcA